MKFEGGKTWWADKTIELVKLENGRVFALNGWNGESYQECWECLGRDLMEASNEHYVLAPISEGIGEANEDGTFDQYETVEYEMRNC